MSLLALFDGSRCRFLGSSRLQSRHDADLATPDRVAAVMLGMAGDATIFLTTRFSPAARPAGIGASVPFVRGVGGTSRVVSRVKKQLRQQAAWRYLPRAACNPFHIGEYEMTKQTTPAINVDVYGNKAPAASDFLRGAHVG